MLLTCSISPRAAMVFNTGGLISVKVVPDRSPLEVSFTQKFTENVAGGGRARYGITVLRACFFSSVYEGCIYYSCPLSV